MDVVRLDQLPVEDLEPLVVEGRAQGFEFLDRLVAEYTSGANCFSQPGEALFGVYCERRLIAIGGLNRDPYLQGTGAGRVRHVYVLDAWRGQGVSKRLVQRIVREARGHYRVLTLRTVSEQADRFYCALGFVTEPPVRNATHHLILPE